MTTIAAHRALTDVVVTRGDSSTYSLPAGSLDEAFERVIHSGRCVTDLAARVHVPAALLYRFATPATNPSGEHRDPPAKLITPLTQATGRYEILERLARENGGVFVPLPQVEVSAAGLLAHAGRLHAEVADVGGALAVAVSEGITPDEARALRGELAQLAREVQALDLLAAQAEAPDRKPGAKAARR